MAFTRFYRRRFLNRRGHHGGAYVIADVGLDSLPRDERRQVDGVLTISDCSRIVNLDFWAEDRRAMANALHKARCLQVVVDDFVDALEAAAKEIDLL